MVITALITARDMSTSRVPSLEALLPAVEQHEIKIDIHAARLIDQRCFYRTWQPQLHRRSASSLTHRSYLTVEGAPAKCMVEEMHVELSGVGERPLPAKFIRFWYEIHSFLIRNSFVFDTKFLVFDTEFLVLNKKFVVFTHCGVWQRFLPSPQACTPKYLGDSFTPGAVPVAETETEVSSRRNRISAGS